MVAGRRLAAVQLVATNSATAREVAAGFGMAEPTLWRWRDGYARDGVAGLLPKKKGPKRPSKLSEDKVAEITQLRRDGLVLRAIATRVGVSHDSVLRALGPMTSGAGRQVAPTNVLEPLAPPADRAPERRAARAGMLDEAAPVITEGASLPLAGSLSILPALVATGLVEVMAGVYGAGRRVAGVRRRLLWVAQPRALRRVLLSCRRAPAEGLTRLDPVTIGRLLGLDRAPEVRRMRARLAELAAGASQPEWSATPPHVHNTRRTTNTRDTPYTRQVQGR